MRRYLPRHPGQHQLQQRLLQQRRQPRQLNADAPGAVGCAGYAFFYALK
jgi:hypothetical protein